MIAAGVTCAAALFGAGVLAGVVATGADAGYCGVTP